MNNTFLKIVCYLLVGDNPFLAAVVKKKKIGSSLLLKQLLTVLYLSRGGHSESGMGSWQKAYTCAQVPFQGGC